MRISYLALSDTRCTVQIPGCNFNCRGCFSNQRHNGGVEVSAARIAGHIPPGIEVMLAGGEPTLYRQELLSLIHELDRQRVILSINGYLPDRSLLENLSGIIVHIDPKAFILPSLQQPPHNHIRTLWLIKPTGYQNIHLFFLSTLPMVALYVILACSSSTHTHLHTLHMPAAVRHPPFGDASPCSCSNFEINTNL